jgi:S1-C subfamily serine protease
VSSRQLAVPVVAALIGSAITAVAMTASGDDGEASRQAGVLAASSEADERLSVKEVVERVSPGVVHVQARGVQPAVGEPFGGGTGPTQGIATGSGFVLDEEGRIVTSAGVVRGVTDLHVTFGNLRSVPARVVGKDEETDLALLQVDPEGLDLRPIELGDSSALERGDQAVLVANPSGLGTIAGTGTVASVGDAVESPDGLVLRDVLETDAYIEPGGDGAPLVGGDGRVIGISSGAASGPEGLGVAVPSNTARGVFAELEESHKVIRPYIGLQGRTITAAQTTSSGPEPEAGSGVQVVSVYAGGPAEQAGLQGSDTGGGGDVIEAIDGEAVSSLPELLAEIASHQPGDTVTLSVLRSGSRGEVTVRLTERPASLPSG